MQLATEPWFAALALALALAFGFGFGFGIGFGFGFGIGFSAALKLAFGVWNLAFPNFEITATPFFHLLFLKLTTKCVLMSQFYIKILTFLYM